MTRIARNTTDQGSPRVEDVWSAGPADAELVSRAATADDITPSGELGTGVVIPTGGEVRKRLGWGAQYLPPIDGREERRRFSEICGRVLGELDDLEGADYLVDGKVSDEGAGVIAEIANLLEKLFDCPFGEGESLKSVVAAIQSQTNNADWSRQIVDFLRDVMVFLRARYVVNDQTVDEVYEIVKEHGLDPFRGSVSDRGIKTRYRLVKAEDH